MWEIKAWEVWEQARNVRKERSLRKSKICEKKSENFGMYEMCYKKWDVRNKWEAW